MMRNNLLVIRVVILGIFILLNVSISVQAEEIKVSVTAYTLKECYQNKGITASGEYVRPGIVAVSRDLEKQGLKLGTKIKISGMGTFVVKDRTSRKNRSNIDIFMNSHAKAIRFGRQKYTFLQNNKEEFDLSNGRKKYVCILK